MNPVKTPAQESNILVGSVTSVGPGSAEIRLDASGQAQRVSLSNHINPASLRVGDRVIVLRAAGEYHLVSAVSNAKRKSSLKNAPREIRTTLPGSINGISTSYNVQIVGDDGVVVTTDLASGKIRIKVEAINKLKSISQLEDITFKNGAALAQVDDGFALVNGNFISATQSFERGWSLSADGGWRMIRRDVLRAGPEITDEHFIWWSKTGVPLARYTDTGVYLGLPGSENELWVTPEDGLRIHGKAIVADTLDAEMLGPSLTRYLSELMPTNPIVIEQADVYYKESPWELGIADPVNPTALVFDDGITLWAQAGYGEFEEDGIIFRVGPEGMMYGGPNGYVHVDKHGNVSMPADVIVSGSLKVGEVIYVGTGEWGDDFAGVAISADFGLVGQLEEDDFDSAPDYQGSYQILWSKKDGKFYWASGRGVLDSVGFKYNQDDDNEISISELQMGIFVDVADGEGYFETMPARILQIDAFTAGQSILVNHTVRYGGTGLMVKMLQPSDTKYEADAKAIHAYVAQDGTAVYGDVYGDGFGGHFVGMAGLIAEGRTNEAIWAYNGIKVMVDSSYVDWTQVGAVVNARKNASNKVELFVKFPNGSETILATEA